MAGILEMLLSPVTRTAGAISAGLMPAQQRLLEMRANVDVSAQDKLDELRARRAAAERARQLDVRKQELQPLLRGLPTNVAGALGPLLTSPDPAQAEFGRQQLAEYQRRGSPAAQAVLQGQQIDNARGVQALENERQLGPMQRAAEQALAVQRYAAAQASQAKFAAARTGTITDIEARQNQRWLAQMEAPVQVQDAVQQAEAALQTGDSLGSLAAVIKLAKVLDPTSVVREGEVTTVQGGTGVAESLISQYNRIFSKGFSPSGAAALRRTLKAAALPVLRRGVRITDEIRQQALDYGVAPDRVTIGIGWDDDFARAYEAD